MVDGTAPGAGDQPAKRSGLLDHLRTLVGRVGRAYYDAKHVVVLDYLTRFPYVRDDELLSYLKWQHKEVLVVLTKLKKDRLVKTQLVPDERPDGKKYQRPLHYIDYRDFVNAVKWRIYKNENAITRQIKQADQAHNYVCTMCGTEYDIFEAAKYKFFCENDMEPLVESSETAGNQISNETLKRFLEQHRIIRDLLKEMDGKKIPKPDFEELLKRTTVKTENANDIPAPAGPSATSVSVPGQASETKPLVAEIKPPVKTVSNAMPIWFSTSTVTGKRYDDGVVSPTTFKAPQLPEVKKEEEDEDESYLREYYEQLHQRLTQERATDASQGDGGVLLAPSPNYPTMGTPASVGMGSPPSMPANLDDDTDEEEFVEVEVGFEDAAVGQKRKLQ
ncbi:hypothetical protein DFJ74DRAFT_661270 [Hyaloraphidium curvatum]|nr:hypothetical protein DFJ74DRAFT_661270 [Hyaloraphidium curvatum]